MVEHEEKHRTSGGLFVLQWLSYAFWGWLIVGLTWLFALILINFVFGPDNINNATPFALASTIVLLPIAFVVDQFYRKHETLQKKGASMVIMIIHAVLFALISIGTLVSLVFTGLQLLIDATPTAADSLTVGFWTLLFTALAYAALFLRVLNPFKTRRASLFFGLSMIVAAAALVVLTIIGPVMQSVALRTDRLLRDGLPAIPAAMVKYVEKEGKLPIKLDELTIEDKDAQAVLDQNLVVYKPEGLMPSPKGGEAYDYLYYQLCVTYKAKSPAYDLNGREERYRSTSLNTYSHPAGETCYDLYATYYDETNLYL